MLDSGDVLHVSICRYDAFAQFEEEVADVKIGPTRTPNHYYAFPFLGRASCSNLYI